MTNDTITPAELIGRNAHMEAMTMMTQMNNAHPASWRITIPENPKLRMFVPEYRKAYMSAFNRMMDEYIRANS